MPGFYQRPLKDQTTAQLRFDLVFFSVIGILAPLMFTPLFWPPHFSVGHLLLAAFLALWGAGIIISAILPCAKELRRRKKEGS